jgi:hypothetical protein
MTTKNIVEEELEPTPELAEITGAIAWDLKETFKASGIKVESWDDLGQIEFEFPDGMKYVLDIAEQ